MIKPHIKLLPRGIWACTLDNCVGYGTSLAQCYDMWRRMWRLRATR